MMAALAPKASLMDQLPPVRGRYEADAPLSKINRFRVGGAAEILFQPADTADLVQFMRGKPEEVPITTIGVGSNLLIRDGGIPGIVVRLGSIFSKIEVHGKSLRVGAGAVNSRVASAAEGAALTGLEFLCGIPGGIGGSLRMNAGAYGTEMKDIVESARAVDAWGEVHDLDIHQLKFEYRRSGLPGDWIFIEATLTGRPGNRAEISDRMITIRSDREESQPTRMSTGGSTFKNPAGMKAWELIEQAGCRGLKYGGAMVSEQHCNFLINTGKATAADLENLGEAVRTEVKAKTGVTLDWEIQRMGVPSAAAPKEAIK